ncbi:MAG: DUF2207 domain-containing protein [Clostridiales bacterium]|jgi:hypothetical protein|nr:DUF2207 domain-containing protein [Clostridiales bacterium]
MGSVLKKMAPALAFFVLAISQPAFAGVLQKLPGESLAAIGADAELHMILMPLITAFCFVLPPMLTGRKLCPEFQSYPPLGMTPADLAVAIKGKALPRDMICMVFYWASKGYMDMTEVEMATAKGPVKGFMFRKLKTMGMEAKQHEMKMFREMFTYGQENTVLTSDLESGTFRLSLEEAAKEAKRSYNTYKRRHFKRSFLRSATVALPGIASLTLALYPFVFYYWFTESLFTSVMASIGISIGIALILGTPIFIGLGKTYAPEKMAGGLAIALIPLAIVAGLLFGLTYRIGIFPRLATGFVCIVAALILAFICKRRTEAGARYWEHVLGFKLFLESASKAKLQELEEEDPEYFTSVLPYAMVLGYGEQWTKNHGVAYIERPHWYHAQGNDILKPQELAADISEGLAGLR